MSTAPELPEKTREHLKELRGLSDRAEAGDAEARRELRKALHESSPEVVAQAADFARRGQKVLVSSAAGKDPLVEEALLARLDLMRVEISGEAPHPARAAFDRTYRVAVAPSRNPGHAHERATVP